MGFCLGNGFSGRMKVRFLGSRIFWRVDFRVGFVGKLVVVLDLSYIFVGLYFDFGRTRFFG